MGNKNNEQLDEHNDETQETSPEVSGNENRENNENNQEHKEQEQDNTEQNTETNLADLQKEIDQMIASNEYKDENEKKLQEMKSDIEKNKNNKNFLEQKAKEIEEMKKQKNQPQTTDNPSLWKRFFYGSMIGGFMNSIGWKDGKEWADKKMHEAPKESNGGVWNKIGNAFLVAGAFVFGKKAFGKITEFFGKKNEETEGVEHGNAFSNNNQEQHDNQQNNTENNTNTNEQSPDTRSEDEWLASLKAGYPTFDERFLTAWAAAIAGAQESFVLDEKTYYFSTDKFLSADHEKFLRRKTEQGESVGEDAATGEQEPPLQAGEKPEIENGQKQEQELYQEYPNALWVLSRMSALGYIPSKLYKWRLANRMANVSWNMKASLMKMIPSMRDNLVREKAFLIANGVNQHDYDTRLNTLEAMHQDIKSGKITSLNELQKKYPDMIDTKKGMIDKLLWRKKTPLNRANKKIVNTLDNMKTKEEQLRELDRQMTELEQESQKKYQALNELDKQAEKDPAKEKELRKKVQDIADDYNKKARQIHAETGARMVNMSESELLKYQRQFKGVDKLIKLNGGAGKFIQKVNSHGGRFMMKVGVAGLMFRAGSDIMTQGVISKETGLDVADMGIGLIPVAGGLYDVGMAIYGKDLNGREMSTADRWIRGAVGVGSTVLDIFSFGIAGTAVRAGVKTTEATVKVVEGAVKTERTISKGTQIGTNVYKGAKALTHAAMFTGLCYGVYMNTEDVWVGLGRPAYERVEAINTPNTQAA